MKVSTQKGFLFIVTLVLIAGTAGALSWLKSNQRLGPPGLIATAIPGSVPMRIELPARVLDFTSTNVPTSDVVLGYLPKDTSYAQRHYQAPDGAWALANLILMGADRTSIHRPDYCLPGQGWQIQKKTEVKLPIGGAHPYVLPVMKWTVGRTATTPEGGRQELKGIYVFWFVTDHQTTDNFPGMLKSIFINLVRHGVMQRWAYVSYFSVCLPGQEEAMFARMQQLIVHSVPAFQLPPASAK